jgi:ketosteroid isomerase-like protein
MPANVDVARDLYAAFERADPARLLALLDPEFTGHVSQGMPAGWGGTHAGPAAMLAEVWEPAWRRFRARPVPGQFLSCADGTVVVTGTYVGQAQPGAHPLNAGFTHVLGFREGRVRELRQVTDTRQWARAAADADADLVRRLFTAVERRDRQAVLDTYASDVVIREAASLPYGGVYHGHNGAMRHARTYAATWDHLQSTEDRGLEPRIRSHDGQVVVSWQQKATAGDGRRLDVPVVDLIGVHDGRVASLEMFPQDTAAVLGFLEAAAGLASGRSSGAAPSARPGRE